MKELENMAEKEEKLSYEEAIARLEKIVSDLEKGDITLSEAEKAFSQGGKLVTICYEHLNRAKGKLTEVTGLIEKLVSEE